MMEGPDLALAGPDLAVLHAAAGDIAVGGAARGRRGAPMARGEARGRGPLL